MAERPSRPRFAETTTDSPSSLAIILSKNRDITGLKLSDGPAGSALPYAKKLLAEDATPAQKKQLKKAWEWRDGEYAKWHRACAEFDAMQRNAESDEEEYAENSAGERKRKRQKKKDKNESEADEKAKELREAHDQMQRAYDADPQKAIFRFTDKLQELSKEPASAAIDLNGLCACSGSHAVVKSLGLAVAVAAETYWRAHPVSAPREPLDVPRLLREVLARVPDLRGAEMASDQWAVLASGACSYIEVELPPEIEFDEVKVRGNYESRKNYNQQTEKGRGNLDTAVKHWTGISGEALGALSHSDKINMIVEARRKAHQAPIDKISRAAEPLFDALVTCRTSAAEYCDLDNAVGLIAHGIAIATTRHVGLMDAELVDRSIEVFEAAKADSLIQNPQDFYSGSRSDPREGNVGMRFTESLMSADSPIPKMGARGRISVINNEHLYATDLSRVKELVVGVVMDGGVKDVEDAENSHAMGRLVVALHRRGELYYFLVRRGHFLLVNEFTPACAVKILRIAVPLLFLTHRQDTNSVPRLKLEERGGGGLVVGKAANSGMIAGFKNVVPKMVRQVLPLLAKAASSVDGMDHLTSLQRLFAARALSSDALDLERAADGLTRGFSFNAADFGKILEKMGEVPAVREASVAFRHLLCSSSAPKPAPAPAPAPPPRPTNKRNTNPGHNWTQQEYLAGT